MNFYDLPKSERLIINDNIYSEIQTDFMAGSNGNIIKYASDPDTYIRKCAYLAVGKIYRQNRALSNKIIESLEILLNDQNEKIRQTAVFALGEIGKMDFERIEKLLLSALQDPHHSVRNSIVGALKQMGQKNTGPVFEFVKSHIHNNDPLIRREMIHGIELRGRTHPEEAMPILYELQNDPDKQIRKMVIHVIGQISYKKGCLEEVILHLNGWQNTELVKSALFEIIKVHKSYERFSEYTVEKAKQLINKEWNLKI